MDKIRILNLKIPGRHGVYDFEKDKDHLFELDVEMQKSLSEAGKSDVLKDTVNYDDVVSGKIETYQKPINEKRGL